MEEVPDIITSTRVLYISGSVGLGHARRDLAIARELRRLDSDIEIVWLAGEPARQVISEAGETLLDESAAYGDEPLLPRIPPRGSHSICSVGSRCGRRARGSVPWPSLRR